MEADIAGLIDDMGHASTIAAIRMGENPEGVDTYSQLALLNDNETAKRARTFRDRRRQIGTLVELGVYDIRKYWPDEKQILVAGAESQIERVMFEKAQIPDFFMVSIAPGAPAPRSQGAQLKQLDAIWAAAVQAWVAVNDGNSWVEWYAESVKAGKPLDLPSAKSDTQRDLAYLENRYMAEGILPPVMDYDVLTIHLPVHREAEDQARAAGDEATVQRITLHIQQHIAQAQANAAQLQATAEGQPPTAALGQPGAPGSAQPFGAANGAGQVQYMNPRAREPYPQTIPGDFASLARGQ
jgi:GAF domain-containing protein